MWSLSDGAYWHCMDAWTLAGCCGLAPPGSCSLTPCSVAWGRESEGWKWESSWVEIKTVSQDKQNKEFIHRFPSQAGVQPSPAKQGCITRNGDSGRQTPSLWTSPPPPSPALYAERDVLWYGLCFWPVWSALLAVSPPSFLCTCQASVRSWKALHYLRTTKASTYYQHSSHTKFKTQHYISY